MKTWECTVCKYIYEKEQLPGKCPVCGAGKEYFAGMKSVNEEQTTTAGSGRLTLSFPGLSRAELTGFTRMVMNYRLHPVSVYTPNGVLPLGFVFLFFAVVLDLSGFERAAFYNFVFVLLIMPLVILSGIVTWRNRYQGILNKTIVGKIITSVVVAGALVCLVVWRVIDPGVTASAGKWLYLLIALIMVVMTGCAGYLGGKVVLSRK